MVAKKKKEAASGGYMSQMELREMMVQFQYFVDPSNHAILKSKKYLGKKFSAPKIAELAETALLYGQKEECEKIIAAGKIIKPKGNYTKKAPPTMEQLEKKGTVKVPVNYRNQGVIIPSITYAFGTGVATENTKVSMFLRYGPKFVVVGKNEAEVEKAMKHLATMK